MRYETAVPIGRGGIAEVLRAWDPELKRDVALKLLRRDDPVLAERMLREAQAQARVAHPNVCPVYETGTTDDGQLYIAMQFIDGLTLDAAAREMRLEQKVGVLRDIASAVQAAHSAGLIHRDLKPSNILVERQADGSIKPWVLDFGIARQHDAPGLTMTGQVVGTPAYMPPEQARGDHATVDRRADVYALGAVAYHLLTGGPPFTGQSTVDVLVKILQTDPVPVRKVATHLPADLETIVMKCLEKDPERRYGSARAMARDLTSFLEGEPIAARPVGLAHLVLRKVRKNKTAAALLALITLALPVGTVKYTFDLRSERERALTAQREVEDLMDFMLRDLYNRLEPLGRVELLHEVAQKSLRHYEGSDDDDSDVETTYRRGRAFRNVGLVLEAEGDLEEALRSFEKYQSIMLTLAERAPDNIEWSLALANSHRLVGEALQEQGRLEEAFLAYSASLELARALAQRDPARPELQIVLWQGHADVGWLLLEKSELDEAMIHFQTGLDVLKPLLELHPEQVGWRYNLSSNLAYVGLAQQDQGDLEAALRSFEQALAEAEVVTRADPSNAKSQFDLSLNHGRVAYILLERGDLEGAIRSYRTSLDINERLVEQDSSNVAWQRELAVNHSGLGAAFRYQGRLDEARDAMEKSLSITRRLAARDPTNASMTNDLAWDLAQVGMIYAALGDDDAARRAWEEAAETIAPVAEATGVPYYLDTQVLALLNLGRVEEARPIVERLEAAGWDDPEFLELCRRHGL